MGESKEITRKFNILPSSQLKGDSAMVKQLDINHPHPDKQNRDEAATLRKKMQNKANPSSPTAMPDKFTTAEDRIQETGARRKN